MLKYNSFCLVAFLSVFLLVNYLHRKLRCDSYNLLLRIEIKTSVIPCFFLCGKETVKNLYMEE